MDTDADAHSVAESDDVSVMTEDDYGPQEGDSVQVCQPQAVGEMIIVGMLITLCSSRNVTCKSPSQIAAAAGT